MSLKIMVIAGETSGDMRAAELVHEFNLLKPDAHWFGIGGPQMRAAGVKTHYDIDDMDVMGLAEVIRRYPFFKKVFNEMLQLGIDQQPDAVLLVDYPGFNLRLAKALAKQGIRTTQYVSPQVWAWHRSRVHSMAQSLDLLMTIFPFEAEYFNNTSLAVEYVGHPLVDSISQTMKTPSPPLPWNAVHHVGLLPGSRPQEIERLLPVMLSAAALISEQKPDYGFLIGAPSPKQAKLAHRLISQTASKPRKLTIITGHTRDILRQADAAMVCSGTATLEAALIGCPMAVCYKMNAPSYVLFRPFVQVKHIGMVNIIAGEEVCPELVQFNFTPRRLAETIIKMATPGAERNRIQQGLHKVQQAMGAPGAAQHAAHTFLKQGCHR